MTMRRSLLLGSLVFLLASGGRVRAEEPNDPSVLTVKRIFDSGDFKEESLGATRWLKDGSGYTALEDSQDTKDGKDIVRYDPATGRREVLVPASRLVPPEQSKPLRIDDYTWSQDGTKLLIFTNSKRVWRRNTRGDYWVLHLAEGKLEKLGGKAEPNHAVDRRRLRHDHQRHERLGV